MHWDAVRGGLRLLWGVLVISLHGCCTAPKPARVVPKPTPSQEKVLSDLLREHSVDAPAFALVREAIVQGLRDALAPGKKVADVNAPRAADEVILYIIDMRAAFADARLCGGQDDDFAVPVKQRVLCGRTRSTRFNCAVVGASTIACDYRLFWRLARYAAVAALASLEDASSRGPRRQELRRMLIRREIDQLEREDALSKLSELRQLVEKKPGASEPFERLWRGFTEYVIAHEAGHLYHGHGSGKFGTPCASATGREILLDSMEDFYAVACSQENPIEVVADDFAIQVLSRGVSPDRFTGARATPELFMEEFERRTMLAILDLGKDPDTWDIKTASEEERDLFNVIWLARIATAGHPQDLRRYARLMKMLEDRGVLLSSDRQVKQLAEEYLASLQRLCSQAGHPSLNTNPQLSPEKETPT